VPASLGHRASPGCVPTQSVGTRGKRGPGNQSVGTRGGLGRILNPIAPMLRVGAQSCGAPRRNAGAGRQRRTPRISAVPARLGRGASLYAFPRRAWEREGAWDAERGDERELRTHPQPYRTHAPRGCAVLWHSAPRCRSWPAASESTPDLSSAG